MKKMKKSTKIIGGLSAGVLATAFIITPAIAYRGDYTTKGPNCSPERHATMTEAMANNDYNAWKESMAGHGRVTQVINEENFSKFAEAHRLAEEGDLDGADKIREELGLRTRDGKKIGAGHGKGQDNQDRDKGERSGQGHGR